MLNFHKIFYAGMFVAVTALFHCSDNFTEELKVEDISPEDSIWLHDGNNDGLADSIQIYAADCELPIMECHQH